MRPHWFSKLAVLNLFIFGLHTFEFSFFLQKQLEFVEQLLKPQSLAVVHIDIIYIYIYLIKAA